MKPLRFRWLVGRVAVVLAVLLLVPSAGLAAGEPVAEASWLDADAYWTVVPFVLLLLAIAILPLAAGHPWESNWRKALVALAFALPVAGYLALQGSATAGRSVDALEHGVAEYGSFIILLASLYTIAGGIVIRGNIRGTPLVNTTLLTAGAILANFIGTTGASVVLIRPLLRINQERQRTAHLPIFFIFVVSNVGGLLTPLGDPPLFLGFLNGVDFFWTLALWRQWLVVNGAVLAIFLIWDTIAYQRETLQPITTDAAQAGRLQLAGRVNLLFLVGVLAAVLFQSRQVLGGELYLRKPWGELLMVAMAVASLVLTPRGLRAENRFTWHPIIEVAVLFAGIFVTMVPALELLRLNGPRLNINEPWMYFWLTGSLSSFLDNAPTYMTLASLAAGPNPLGWLVEHRPAILAAISCGAVFMGANTYIGNGPNFMVKAIAEEAGVRMPSFFGYTAYSCLILLPVFGVVTYLFF